MEETAEQYRTRLLAAIDGMNPLRVQAETAAKLHRLLRSSNPAAWARQPSPGVWSPAEIVAHLADCEIVYGYRIRLILGNPGVPIQPFNQDHWAERMEYNKQPPLDSLRAFASLRAVNLRLLRRLTPEQMQFHGEHAERGPETIEMIVAPATT